MNNICIFLKIVQVVIFYDRVHLALHLAVEICYCFFIFCQYSIFEIIYTYNVRESFDSAYTVYNYTVSQKDICFFTFIWNAHC